MATQAEDKPPRFWTVTQNNSQGVFDDKPEHGIGYGLCVEAYSAAEAEDKMRRIVNGYAQGPYCPCCGERWYISLYEDEGTDEPMLYDKPLEGGWGMRSYVHHLNGQIAPVGTGDERGW